jgi:hypothetical protein
LKNEIKDILEKLEKGKITVEKAIELIRETKPDWEDKTVKATKLKIIIIDKKEGKSLYLPSIPFWLAKGIGNLGLKLSSLGIKHSDNIDENTKKHLEKLKDLDLNKVFDVLKEYGPCDIVHITEEDKTEIRISTL